METHIQCLGLVYVLCACIDHLMSGTINGSNANKESCCYGTVNAMAWGLMNERTPRNDYTYMLLMLIMGSHDDGCMEALLSYRH